MAIHCFQGIMGIALSCNLSRCVGTPRNNSFETGFELWSKMGCVVWQICNLQFAFWNLKFLFVSLDFVQGAVIRSLSEVEMTVC